MVFTEAGYTSQEGTVTHPYEAWWTAILSEEEQVAAYTAQLTTFEGQSWFAGTHWWMWFDYEGANVLVNVATQRKKVEWIRANPQLSLILVNPANMYHWVSIKCTVKRETPLTTRRATGWGPSRRARSTS